MVIGLKSKKELIETAMTLDTGKEYCQLYEFAAKYLTGIKQRGSTNEFFATLTTLKNNSGIRQNSTAMGFSGNNNAEIIKKWCSYILSHRELTALEYDELHYVMGYCARLAKIHQEGC